MLILSKNDAYASDIINMLKESEMIVVEGTLYPLLTRLKNSGLLVLSLGRIDAGATRKYYTITEQGRLFLKSLTSVGKSLSKHTVYS